MKRRFYFLSLFVVLAVFSWGQKTIGLYEYWFDDNYTGKIVTHVSPVSLFQLNTSVSTSILPTGLHTFQIRFKESTGVWSSTTTQFFVKPPKTIEGQGMVSQYEYWFDSNYTRKVQQTVSLQSGLSLVSSVSASSLPAGLHTFQIRFKGSAGAWSSTTTQFFIKPPKTIVGKGLVSQYEYWFDSNYTGKVQQTVSPQNELSLVSSIPASSLPAGLHTFQIRFKGSTGAWSSTTIQFFVKHNLVNVIENKILAYRYWIDKKDSAIKTVNLSQSVNPLYLSDKIYFASLDSGFHIIHFQFQDVFKNWSSVSNDTIYPYKNIITITSTLNNTYNTSDTLSVAYSILNPIRAGNTFSVQLSDPQGSFAKPIVIGQIIDTIGGKIMAAIPANLTAGCEYRLRVVSDSPFVASKSVNIAINMAITSGDYMLKFDGVDDYADFGTWFNKTQFTVSFWMNADSLQVGAASVIALQNDLEFYTNPILKDNYILMHLLQLDIPHNKWVHVTITMDGTTNTRKVYLFGQLIDQNQWSYNPQTGYNLRLGHGSSFANGYWKGEIDELKLWDHVLTSDEITKNVYSKLSGNEKGLLGYWDFNNGCSDIVRDLSANGHNGILMNGVAKVPSTVPSIGQQVVPNQAGNTNIVSIKVYDNLFKKGAKVKLISSGHKDILADTTIVNNDGTIATGSFNLAEVDTALYSVIVMNPDSTIKTYTNSFTIVPGTKPDVWVNIIGSNKVRNGRPFIFLVNYGNRGNVDARGVVLWVTVPASAKLTPNFPILVPDSTYSFGDSLSYYVIDTINGLPIKVIPLFISRMSPNSFHTLSFTLDSLPDSDFSIYAWSNLPYFQSPLKYSVSACQEEIIDKIVAPIPIVGCLWSALGAVLEPIVDGIITAYIDSDNPKSMYYGLSNGNFDTFNYYKLIYKSYKKAALDCKDDLLETKAKDVIKEIAKGFFNPKEIVNLINLCKDDATKPISPQNVTVKPVNSYDPNEKVGPDKYMNTHTPFNYMISFENKATATASAQMVSVTDTLDMSKFDIKTFSFGGIGIGDTIITGFIPYQKQFSQLIDLRKKTGVLVKTVGSLDLSTGIARWQFTALDTTTLELTTDASAGFLPPNKTGSEGMGWVSYNIMPYDTLATGTPLSNKATIVFDYNPPIATNTHENIIDKISPVSSVQLLNTVQNDSVFVVNWDGTDVGSGIKYYTIYCQKDSSAYSIWLQNTSVKSATFTGSPNHTYSFYSLATDSAGNVETKTNVPDVTMMVIVTAVPKVSSETSNMNVFPNPSTNGLGVYVTFNIPDQELKHARLVITSMLGSIVKEIDLTGNRIHIEDIDKGMFVFDLRVDGESVEHKKVVIQ